MTRLMARSDRPTAVVCGNDVLAIGAVLGARDAGLHVPGAVSVAGFDDLPLAGEFAPALTTMRVPAEAMGEQAASYLINRLEAGARPDPIPPLGVELIVRETTGPVP